MYDQVAELWPVRQGPHDFMMKLDLSTWFGYFIWKCLAKVSRLTGQIYLLGFGWYGLGRKSGVWGLSEAWYGFRTFSYFILFVVYKDSSDIIYGESRPPTSLLFTLIWSGSSLQGRSPTSPLSYTCFRGLRALRLPRWILYARFKSPTSPSALVLLLVVV